jgi:putative ABC transport system ATP-binding protein
MQSPPVAQAVNLEKSYKIGKVTVQAVRGVNLSLEKGQFVVVTGPSGSGKTTLLNLIGTLDKPTGGQVLIDGRDLAGMKDGELTNLRRHKIGFIFQFHNLIPVLTALENVQLPLLTAKVKSHEARERARLLLGKVGLSERVDHLPDELSGGEQQRVAIARALANHPVLVLADEPTGELDTKTGSETVKILYQLAKQENTAVLAVTHDPVVAEKADVLYEMRDGQLHSSPPPQGSYRIQAVEPVPPQPRTSLSQPN